MMAVTSMDDQVPTPSDKTCGSKQEVLSLNMALVASDRKPV
jgi:hypothetical protein